MDSNLLKTAVDFHGEELSWHLGEEQQIDAGRLIHPQRPAQSLIDRDIRDPHFREKLLKFLAQKADLLYQDIGDDSGSGSQPFENNDFYAIMPSLETFMGVSVESSRHHLYNSIDKRDVVIGVISTVLDSGLVITLLCMDYGKSRVLDQLKITAFCPVKELPKDFGNDSPVDGFQVKDKVRAVVISVNQDTEKIILSLLSKSFPPDAPCPKLGIINDDEFPVSYSRHLQIRGVTYDELLHSIMGFNNCHCVPYLMMKLNVETDPIHPPSLTRTFSRLKISKTEYAESLRKAQSSKLAMKSVAEGVSYFKAGKSLEAMQLLNKALQIDESNVEALVARGALFANNESYNKAITDFKAAMRTNPRHVNARKYLRETLLARGRELHDGGKFEDAESYYHQALELDQNDEEVIFYLRLCQQGEVIQKPISRKQQYPDRSSGEDNRRDQPRRYSNEGSLSQTKQKLKQLIEEDKKGSHRGRSRNPSGLSHEKHIPKTKRDVTKYERMTSVSPSEQRGHGQHDWQDDYSKESKREVSKVKLVDSPDSSNLYGTESSSSSSSSDSSGSSSDSSSTSSLESNHSRNQQNRKKTLSPFVEGNRRRSFGDSSKDKYRDGGNANRADEAKRKTHLRHKGREADGRDREKDERQRYSGSKERDTERRGSNRREKRRESQPLENSETRKLFTAKVTRESPDGHQYSPSHDRLLKERVRTKSRQSFGEDTPGQNVKEERASERGKDYLVDSGDGRSKNLKLMEYLEKKHMSLINEGRQSPEQSVSSRDQNYQMRQSPLTRHSPAQGSVERNERKSYHAELTPTRKLNSGSVFSDKNIAVPKGFKAAFANPGADDHNLLTYAKSNPNLHQQNHATTSNKNRNLDEIKIKVRNDRYYVNQDQDMFKEDSRRSSRTKDNDKKSDRSQRSLSGIEDRERHSRDRIERMSNLPDLVKSTRQKHSPRSSFTESPGHHSRSQKKSKRSRPELRSVSPKPSKSNRRESTSRWSESSPKTANKDVGSSDNKLTSSDQKLTVNREASRWDSPSQMSSKKGSREPDSRRQTFSNKTSSRGSKEWESTSRKRESSPYNSRSPNSHRRHSRSQSPKRDRRQKRSFSRPGSSRRDNLSNKRGKKRCRSSSTSSSDSSSSSSSSNRSRSRSQKRRRTEKKPSLSTGKDGSSRDADKSSAVLKASVMYVPRQLKVKTPTAKPAVPATAPATALATAPVITPVKPDRQLKEMESFLSQLKEKKKQQMKADGVFDKYKKTTT